MKPDRTVNGLAAGFANGVASCLVAARRSATALIETLLGSFQPASPYIPGRTSDSTRSGMTFAPDNRAIVCATPGDALIAKAFTGASVSATLVVDVAAVSAVLNAALLGAIRM